MMPYHIKLDMPGLPTMNTANNQHWRVRQSQKRDWYRTVAMQARGNQPQQPLQRARVRITRYSAGPEPDFENLTQGGKFLLDGLVRCKVLADDSPAVIGQPEYRWERAPQYHGHVMVEIWEVG